MFAPVLLLLVIMSEQTHGEQPESKVLSIGCFLPGYSEHDYFGYATAIEMARDWINNNSIIPDNYTMEFDCGDTLEMAPYAIAHLGSLLNSKRKKVAFLGPVFTKALLPIAQALQLFSVPQVRDYYKIEVKRRSGEVSFGSSYAYFNNLLEFPYLFRTVPSTEMFNIAKIELLEKYKWHRVGMVFDRDDPPLSLASTLLHKSLIRLGYTVIGPFAISRWDGDFKPVLQKLKEQNVRIFIGDFLSVNARRIFCAAYKLGMVGPKYMWIIHGNIRSRLATEDDRIECKAAQVMEASNLAITVGQLNYILENETTITGETTFELYDRYMRTALDQKRYYRTYSPYAFDAVIALGLVIRDTFYQVDWKNMNYLNHTAGAIFKAAFRKLEFQGLTGLVRFNYRSERMVEVALQQVIDGVERLTGTYDNITNNITFLNKRRSFKWHELSPPLDKERLIKIQSKMPNALSLAMVTFGAAGVVTSVILLCVMKINWHTDEIRKSSPMMNVIITVGCLLSYSTVCLLGVENYLQSDQHFVSSCKAKLWIMSSGFTCTYGSMFAKNWRVFRIMTNKRLRKKLSMISNRHLFGMVGSLIAMDTIYMIVWGITDPVRADIYWKPPKVFYSKDLIVQKYCFVCNSDHYTWWIIGILFYKGILLAFGLFLAFETRHTYKKINESRNIAFTVYNVIVFSVIAAITAFVLRKHETQELSYGIIGSSIIICTTITLMLIFLPRVIALIQRKLAKTRDRSKDSDHLSTDLM